MQRGSGSRIRWYSCRNDRKEVKDSTILSHYIFRYADLITNRSGTIITSTSDGGIYSNRCKLYGYDRLFLIFSVQMMAYVQTVTPVHLIGKVMSLLMCLVMCAHPLGQSIYGALFEKLSNQLYLIFFCCIINMYRNCNNSKICICTDARKLCM